MTKIILPNGWKPRPYQRAMWDYLEAGGKRAIGLWHRRAGKDDVMLHRAAVAAFERKATYWHCLPEYAQARKAIWNAVNSHTGKRRIDEAFPHELRASTNDNEMFIRFKNGSTWQVIGSDRYNSLVGAGVAGVTFSEWALCNPSSWGYISPMMRENNGWAAFITTPRGRNHAHAMYQSGLKNPDWFAERLSIHDTQAILPEALEEVLQTDYIDLYGEDIGRAQFEQEYEVSFNAAILGAFYAREMVKVRKEGRISPEAQAIEGAPVHRAWDIGVRDDTSIWWFQVVGTQVFILDCYTANGVGVDHFAEVIEQRKKEHGWADGTDFVPHDARVKEWGTGRTRVETMQGFGLNPQVVPQAGKLDGINAARKTLDRCIFHPRTEDVGVSALEQYRREWDDDKKAFKATEIHDWCFTSDTKVVTRHGMCQIGSLPETGEVLTPCGWMRYESPRVTRRNARVVALRFSDGHTVRCTPDHKFLTDSGWTCAENLVKGSRIQSSWTASRSISWAACIAFGRVRSTILRVGQSSIGMFGKTLLGKSLKAITSTTETATPGTIGWTTWSASTLLSTNLERGKIERRAVKGSRSQKTLVLPPPSGTPLKRGANGTGDTRCDQKAGKNGSESRVLASIAALSSIASFARTVISRSFAALTARPLIIESVSDLSEGEDVWCMTVPGAECFALENGATAHNCSHLADAFRYLSMAWREAPRELEKKPAHVMHTTGDIMAPQLKHLKGRRLG